MGPFHGVGDMVVVVVGGHTTHRQQTEWSAVLDCGVMASVVSFMLFSGKCKNACREVFFQTDMNTHNNSAI